MSPPSPVAVDLTFLSTELRVLPTAPPWSATAPALERLDQYRASRRQYQQLKDDISGIGDYATMLAANQRSLTDALFCGAVIGRFAAPTDFASGLIVGLRTVSGALRLADPTPPAGANQSGSLEALANELCDRWSGLRGSIDALRKALTARDNSQWSESLRKLAIDVPRILSFAPQDRQKVVADAWERWREFLLRYPRTAVFTPGIDNLLCRAARIGPDAMLRDVPAEMSLIEWSTACYRGLAGDPPGDSEFAPRWLALIAAINLGAIRIERLEEVAAAHFPEAFTVDELQLLRQTAGEDLQTSGERLFGLVLYGGPSSRVTSWRPPQKFAAVAWTAPQAARILGTASTPGHVPAWLAVDHLFVEAGIPENEITQVIGDVRRVSSDSSQLSVTAFTGNRLVARPGWADRLVVDAADATALIRTAEARVIQQVDELPAALKELWMRGGRLAGTIEPAPPAVTAENVEVDVIPAERYLQLSWQSGAVRREARLVFVADGLLRNDRRFDRTYTVLYDGVTLHAEQRRAESTFLRGPLGRLLGLYAPVESIELKETRDGWVGDVVVARLEGGRRSERRRIHLTTVTRPPTERRQEVQR